LFGVPGLISDVSHSFRGEDARAKKRRGEGSRERKKIACLQVGRCGEEKLKLKY
jgi:hypothetical protein